MPLYPGAGIAQISFHRCGPVAESYIVKSIAKYASSTGTTDAIFYEDYEETWDLSIHSIEFSQKYYKQAGFSTLIVQLIP